jgi:mRNA interferase HigB
VRVISRRALREFWERHTDAEQALRAWYSEAKAAVWRGPADVKVRYPAASIVANNRVVFNIKGNQYRLITAIKYEQGIVFIRFVGTHAEYDQIDAESV